MFRWKKGTPIIYTYEVPIMTRTTLPTEKKNRKKKKRLGEEFWWGENPHLNRRATYSQSGGCVRTDGRTDVILGACTTQNPHIILFWLRSFATTRQCAAWSSTLITHKTFPPWRSDNNVQHDLQRWSLTKHSSPEEGKKTGKPHQIMTDSFF